MRFDSFSAFLHMDGYGLYIWAAYGLTLIILAANIWWPLMKRRRFIREEKGIALRMHHKAAEPGESK